MRWTRDRQAAFLVVAAVVEIFVCEMTIAASLATVEWVSGWLFVAILLNFAFVQVVSARSGARGPFRPLMRRARKS